MKLGGCLHFMGTFFIRKIANIRSDLDNHLPQVCRVDSNDSKTDLPLSKFVFIISGGGARLDPYIQEKDSFLGSDSHKTCSRMLGYSSSRITKIINYSLEHGVLLSTWKNDLVFPLLKKDGLEPIFKLSTGEQKIIIYNSSLNWLRVR